MSTFVFVLLALIPLWAALPFIVIAFVCKN
jgi:hypothetical protein